MIRKICLLLFMGLPVWLQAQVSLSIQLPPGGMIQKDQLWNLVAMNSGNSSFDAVLSLSLQDVSTGQTVLSGSTRSFTLAPGLKNLRIQDLQPVQYNYGAAGADGPYIPLGAYTACYTISRVTTETAVPVMTECARINITPLSPPLLNLPEDGSVVATPYPQFSWVPPAPLTMFTDLSYDLNVVEVLEGQSAAEAISNNSPLYSRNLLHAPYESYATGYSPLERNKTYAWQVTARNGMNYAVATEVWMFRLGPDSMITPVKDNVFIELRDDGPSSGVVHRIPAQQLRVKIRSYTGRYTATFRFYDEAHVMVREVNREISGGDNFISFELDKKFEKKKRYTLELTDQRKKLSSISFIIQ